MTLRAVLDDPLFPSVLGVEGEIDIEISILFSMKPVGDPRASRIGLHGVVLRLPQVAEGGDWNGE